MRVQSVFKLGHFVSLVFLFASSAIYSQNTVSIGTDVLKTNAVLYLKGNGAQAFIIPIVDAVSQVPNPEAGMVVYQSSDNKVYFHNGSQWSGMGSATGGGNTYSLAYDANTNQLTLEENGSGTPITLSSDALSLNGTDLPAGNPSNDQILVFNGTSGAWEYQALPTGSFSGVTVDGTTIQGDGLGNPLSVVSVDDADADPTNELQDAAGVAVTPSGNLTSTDVQAALVELQTDLDASGGTDDQNLILTGDVLSIEGGTGSVDLGTYVNDADADPANEIQNLSLTGTTLNISGGTGVDLAPIIPAASTDDQVAAEVPVTAQNGVTSTNTQSALEELQGEIISNQTSIGTNTANIASNTTAISANTTAIAADTDGDPTNELQNAAGVAVTPAGNLTSTDVQAALVELQTDLDASVGTDDQVATEVPVTAQNGVTSTNTQSALEELQGEIISNQTSIGTNTANIASNTTAISANTTAIAADTDGDPTNELQNAAGVAVTPAGNLTSTDVQAALVELQTDLDASVGTDDQVASEVPVTAQNGVSSTNTQSALEELQSEITANTTALAAVTDDQTALEVAVTPSGNLASVTVQAALVEHQADIDGINTTLGGVTDDQTATEVPVTPTGNLASNNVQAALVELQTDLDASVGTDDQVAAEVPVTAQNGVSSTNTQSALEELQGEITSNQTSIGTNAGNITTNTTNIANNSTAISANATAIAADTDGDPTNELQNAAGVAVTPAGNLTSTDVQAALIELQTDLDASGGTDDQVAAEVPVTAQNGVSSTNAQSALEELQSEITANTTALAAVTDDQTALEVAVTPSGNLASVTVQAALVEHQADIDGINTTLGGVTDDQTATEVPVTPTGNLASNNVQAALVELQTDIDGIPALPSTTDAQIIVSSGATPQAVTMSGDIVINNTGLTAIQDDAVQLDDIQDNGLARALLANSNAGVVTWLAPSNDSQLLGTNGAGDLAFIDQSNFINIDQTGQTGILVGNGSAIGGVTATNNALFRGNGTTLVPSTILDDGSSVGIGALNNTYLFNVSGESNFNDVVYFGGDPGIAGQILVSDAGTGPPIWTDPSGLGFATDLQSAYDGGQTINLASAGTLSVRDNTGSQPILTIAEAGGYVGIGTSTPIYPLEITTSVESVGLSVLANSSLSANEGIRAASFGSANQNTGVTAQASGGSSSFGLYGSADNATLQNVGVRGAASNNANTGGWLYGVQGTNQGATTATNSFGVHGWVTNTGSTNNYGVFGEATGATNNYAGYFGDGDVAIENAILLGLANDPGAAGNVLTSAGPGAPAVWSSAAGISDLQGAYNGGETFNMDGADLVINNTDGSQPYFSILQTDGKVGIGTNTPGYEVDVRGPATNFGGTLRLANSDLTHELQIFPGHSADPNPYILVKNGDPLRFATDAAGFTETMRIDASGNVGIGEPSPAAKLDILGNIKIADGTQALGRVLTSDANGLATWQDAAGGGSLQIAYNGGQSIQLDGTNSIAINNSTATEELFNFNNTGTLRLGNANTSFPGIRQQISVSNTSDLPIVHIENQGSGDASLRFWQGSAPVTAYAVGVDGTDGNFKISYANQLGSNDRFVIHNTGNIGIGTSSPLSKFQIENTLNMFYDENQGQDIIAHNVYENGTGDFRYSTSAGASIITLMPERVGFFTMPAGTAGAAVSGFTTRMNFTGDGLVINGDNLDASSVLDVNSTTKGLLIPRMTTAQRDAIGTPATGLMIYNITTNGFNFYNGSIWTDFGGGSGWGLTGNSGTNASTNFIGTTDTQPLEIKVDNRRIMRYELDLASILSEAPSPNIIGGLDVNSVDAGIIGATISGGGETIRPNQIKGIFSTVGGGRGNIAGGVSKPNATIAGGSGNDAQGNNATIGGGLQNVSTSSYGFVGGGRLNQAIGARESFVGGGKSNIASNVSSIVLGGYYNEATARYASALGGARNKATSVGLTVVGTANEDVSYTTNSWVATEPIFIVGNGEIDPDDSPGEADVISRSNAVTVLKNGNVGIGISSPSVILDINSTDAIQLPVGTTAEQPATPAAGMIRYNSSTSLFEGYNGASWNDISAPSGGSSLVSNTGTNNIFVGDQVAPSNSGTNQTMMGYQAGLSITSGAENTFLGRGAGRAATTSGFNVFVGKDAARAHITGDLNTFVGYQTGYLGTTGTGNTIVGANAGETATGDVNTIIGTRAGRAVTVGNTNVIIGANAARISQSLDRSVIIGNDAGLINDITGGRLTLIGQGAEVGSAGLLNASAIGFLARVDQSNSMVLGSINGVNGATSNTSVGIGTTTPAYPLHVQANLADWVAQIGNSNGAATADILRLDFGTVTPAFDGNALGIYGSGGYMGGIRGDGAGGIALANLSDRRAKENIKDTELDGVDIIRDIRIRDFNYKGNLKNKTGFIAQELYNVYRPAVGGSPDGDFETAPMTVSSVELIPVTIKAIQEQQEIIDSQKAEIEELKAQIAKLLGSEASTQAQLSALKAQIDKLTAILTAEASKGNE